MNMKILSLSLILVIANCVHGMTPEEQIFYKKELDKATKDHNNSMWIKGKKNEKCMKTNIGKIVLQKIKENDNCIQLGLDCNATRDAFYKAHDDYFESEEFKIMVTPMALEAYFHYLKVENLEKLLSESDLNLIVKNLKKKSTEYASLANAPSNNKTTFNNHDLAKIYVGLVKYFRSLPEKRIESTMPEYP